MAVLNWQSLTRLVAGRRSRAFDREELRRERELPEMIPMVEGLVFGEPVAVERYMPLTFAMHQDLIGSVRALHEHEMRTGDLPTIPRERWLTPQMPLTDAVMRRPEKYKPYELVHRLVEGFSQLRNNR